MPLMMASAPPSDFSLPSAAGSFTGPEAELGPRHGQILPELRRGALESAGEPFFVIDLELALERLALWRTLLPTVQPYYAVKCNPDPALLLTLANAGANFDCASRAEMQAVMSLGIDATRILFAHPIKQPSHLRHAAEQRVPLTVFDSELELHKIAEVRGAAATPCLPRPPPWRHGSFP